MKHARTLLATAAVLGGAALALPAIAQVDDMSSPSSVDAESSASVDRTIDIQSSSSVGATDPDVIDDTAPVPAPDTTTETDQGSTVDTDTSDDATTVPNELPATGGGWGANH